MMINSNKLFFKFILIFSVMISISSNSWLGCWIGLEVNLLAFITMISSPNNIINSESSLKYFLTQSIASMNFLFFLLMTLIYMENFYFNFFSSMMIISSILMKLGSFPFHFWYPKMIEGISWINCFILFTWQKIPTMIILTYYFYNNYILFIMLMNTIIGSIGSMSQTSLKKLLSFSSINNLGWMMMSLLINEKLWMNYLLIYSITILNLCMMFFSMNLIYINQLYNSNMNFSFNFFFLLNFLSLGGLPPLMMFFPKWMVINYMMENNMFLYTILFLLTSLILLFIYIQIMFSFMLFSNLKMKWFYLIFKNKMLMLNNVMNFFITLFLITSTFFFF